MSVIESTFSTASGEQIPLVSRPVWFKAGIVSCLCAATIWLAPLLGQIGTFASLDVILSTYLVSLFHGKYRYLFLIHPVFMLVSFSSFGISYSDAGVAFTYIGHYDRFIDPYTLTLDTDLFIQQFLANETTFGVGGIYVGTMPILILPQILFKNPPDITLYFSLGVFTVLYAAVAVTVALHFGVMQEKVLQVIALFSTVSPTFLEMHASLHRYGLMFLGLFLFVIAYIGLFKMAHNFARKLALSFIMLFALVCVIVSKIPLLMSLALFVLLELMSRNKLPVVSSWFSRLNKQGKVVVLVILVSMAQYVMAIITPIYVKIDTNLTPYASLVDMPIIGLVLRLIYAILSPFPWLYFSQWDLYGYNTLFLWTHVLSACLAAWIIFSFFLRLPKIMNAPDDIRLVSLAGVAVMSSLSASSIGYHIYLAPALPFLAVILLKKQYRIPFKFPVGFVVVMEGVAQVARILR